MSILTDLTSLFRSLVAPAGATRDYLEPIPDDKPPSAPDMNIIASSGPGRDITRNFTGTLLTPTDPVIKNNTDNTDIYIDIRQDAQVGAALEQRRLAMLASEYKVIPGGEESIDKEAADSLRAQIDALEWDDIMGLMWWARFYGYSVAEVLYAATDSEFIIADIKVRNRLRFRFDFQGQPRLLTQDKPQDGEELPPRKFWVSTVGADHHDEPYGIGLAHWLYWPVYFKKSGIEFWALHLEKYGSPTALGKFPAGWPDADVQKLLQAMQAIQTDSGVVVPKDVDIDTVKATQGDGGHGKFVDKFDNYISKIILGQTMTMDTESRQFKGDIQESVLHDIVKSDADLICQSFNRGPARWITELNYPGAKIPQVWRVFPGDEETDANVSERKSKDSATDKTLFDMGYRPSAERVEEVYGPGYERRLMAAGPSANLAPEFADPEDAQQDELIALERALESLGSHQFGEQGKELIQPILDKIVTHGLESSRNDIIQLYPELDTTMIEHMLRRYQFVADTWGRLTVNEE